MRFEPTIVNLICFLLGQTFEANILELGILGMSAKFHKAELQLSFQRAFTACIFVFRSKYLGWLKSA